MAVLPVAMAVAVGVGACNDQEPDRDAGSAETAPRELPPLGDPELYRLSRARVTSIEGFTVEEAQDWAQLSGWGEVDIVDLDDKNPPDRPTDYDPHRIGLYVRDGVVIEAWTGG